MNLLIGCITLIFLPILYTQIPNPVSVRWYMSRGNAPMPASVLERAIRAGNVIPYAGQMLLAFGLWLLIRLSTFRVEAIGLTSNNWRAEAAFGCIAGMAWLGLYVWILTRIRPTSGQIASHLILQRDWKFWIPLTVSAAIVEEIWRALCLTTLGGNAVAVGATAAACGVAHPQSRGRQASAVLFAVYSASLFLWTRSLWTTIPAHALVNVGTIGLIHFAYRRAAGMR